MKNFIYYTIVSVAVAASIFSMSSCAMTMNKSNNEETIKRRELENQARAACLASGGFYMNDRDWNLICIRTNNGTPDKQTP